MSTSEFLNLLQEIESAKIFAKLAIANDIDRFLRYADNTDEVRELIKALKDKTNQVSVEARILYLIEQEYDSTYLSPWDTAVSVYAWALYKSDPSAGQIIAEEMIEMPGLWWANQTAQIVIRNWSYQEAGSSISSNDEF